MQRIRPSSFPTSASSAQATYERNLTPCKHPPVLVRVAGAEAARKHAVLSVEDGQVLVQHRLQVGPRARRAQRAGQAADLCVFMRDCV